MEALHDCQLIHRLVEYSHPLALYDISQWAWLGGPLRFWLCLSIVSKGPVIPDSGPCSKVPAGLVKYCSHWGFWFFAPFCLSSLLAIFDTFSVPNQRLQGVQRLFRCSHAVLSCSSHYNLVTLREGGIDMIGNYLIALPRSLLCSTWLQRKTVMTLHLSVVELKRLTYLLAELLQLRFCIFVFRQAHITLKIPVARYLNYIRAGQNIISFSGFEQQEVSKTVSWQQLYRCCDCAYLNKFYCIPCSLIGFYNIRSHSLDSINLSLLLYILLHLSAFYMLYTCGAWYYSVELIYPFHFKGNLSN